LSDLIDTAVLSDPNDSTVDFVWLSLIVNKGHTPQHISVATRTFSSASRCFGKPHLQRVTSRHMPSIYSKSLYTGLVPPSAKDGPP
jgi:hypothetical protein